MCLVASRLRYRFRQTARSIHFEDRSGIVGREQDDYTLVPSRTKRWWSIAYDFYSTITWVHPLKLSPGEETDLMAVCRPKRKQCIFSESNLLCRAAGKRPDP